MGDSFKREMASGGAWAFGGRVLSALCAFLLNLLLARMLTPSDYGAYFVAVNTLIILASAATIGMDQIVVRLVATARGQGRSDVVGRVVTQCALIVFGGALLTAIIFALTSPWLFGHLIHMPVLESLVVPLVLALVFLALQRQLSESFRGLGDIRLATLFGGLRNNGILTAIFSLLGALLLLVLGRMNLKNLCYVIVFCSLIVLLIGLPVLRHSVRRAGARFPAPFAADGDSRFGYFFRQASPLWISMLLITFRLQSMSWFVSAYDSADHVALLGVAQRVMLLLTMPLIIVDSVLPPVVASLYARGELQRMERVIRALSGLVSLPCLLLLMFLLAFGQPILGLFFGSFYQASYPLLLAMCVGQLANIATGAWQVVLPMTGHNRQVMYMSFLMATIHLSFSWIGAYFWGVTGVALAFCLSTIVGNLIGMTVVRRQVGIWTFITCHRKDIVTALDMVAGKLGKLMPKRA